MSAFYTVVYYMCILYRTVCGMYILSVCLYCTACVLHFTALYAYYIVGYACVCVNMLYVRKLCLCCSGVLCEWGGEAFKGQVMAVCTISG